MHTSLCQQQADTNKTKVKFKNLTTLELLFCGPYEDTTSHCDLNAFIPFYSAKYFILHEC